MKLLIYISVLAFFSLPMFAGTTVSVISGKKTVKLNDAVGDNIIKFLSTAPVENIEGNAKEVQGKFILDGDNLENSSGNISLQVLSMKTGLTKRDEQK